MLNFGVYVSLTLMNLLMDQKQRYAQWVDKVSRFLKETGLTLGDGGRCCSVFQSKPVLEHQPDVLFLGYNAQEDYGYVPLAEERFWEGNPSFYADRMKWRIWSKPYHALAFAGYTKPMEDGNFVFMNAVYFGIKTIK